jgi:putative transposase
LKNKYFYTRNLPHWQPNEEMFFITYRLADSLPKTVIEQLKETYQLEKNKPENQSPERREDLRNVYFENFDQQLDNNTNEPHWLKIDKIAEIILGSLLFRNNEHYILWCACIMSNHAHILISTLPNSPLLHVILQNHKKFTAVHCNKELGRNGSFWTEESFDTIVKNEKHYYRCISYIINNPVKIGIVKKWWEYKWTYLHPVLQKDFKLTKDV